MTLSHEILIVIFTNFITIGIFVGRLGGFQKMVDFRLDKIEKKQDEQKILVERIVVVERDIKTAFIRIDEIKEKIK